MTGILAIATSFAAARVSLSDRTVTADDTVAVASTFTLSSDRTAKDNGAAYETWLVGNTPGSYEVRATVQSGALTTGTAGAWLSCISDRSWAVTRSAFGTNTAVLLVEIREAGSGTVKASATITITAVREFGGGGG